MRTCTLDRPSTRLRLQPGNVAMDSDPSASVLEPTVPPPQRTHTHSTLVIYIPHFEVRHVKWSLPKQNTPWHYKRGVGANQPGWVFPVETRIQGGNFGCPTRVPGVSFLSARSLPWRRRVLVTAATSVRRSDRLRSVADFKRGLMCTVDLTPFRVCRALLAFGSETASQGTRESAARRGSVFAATSILQKHRRSVAR